jgi:raffinose/stachyose/melibiose transport system permease protein
MRARRLLLLVPVALLSLAMALPLAWMLLGSLRTNAEILAAPFGLPAKWQWSQWARAWTEGGLAQAGLNSVLVTSATVLLTIFLGAAAAYPLARGRGPRIGPLYLLGLVVPAQAAVVPTFILLRTLHMLDTAWALILPGTAWSLPLAVYLFVGFFRGQPRDAEEAAVLDGCDGPALFWRIALPIARPAAGVVAVITALGTWNDFLFPLLFVHSESARTLPLAMLNFSSQHTTDYGLTFAGLTMMSLPLLIAYAFVQRTMIDASAGVIG